MTVPWSLVAAASCFSDFAYDSEEDIALEVQLRGGRYVDGSYTTVYSEIDGIPLTSVLFAAYSGDTLVITFRGTNGSQDIGNLDVDVNIAGEVALLGYSPTLQRYAAQLIDMVRGIIAAAPAGTEIAFVGHSLGGMYAEQFTQWFYDPTDPYDLEPSDHHIRDFSFGSTGIISSEDARVADGIAFHFTHTQDVVGTYQLEDHIGGSLLIFDLDFSNELGGEAHNHQRYADQFSEIAQSSILNLISADDRILFLSSQGGDVTMDLTFSAVFGSAEVDAQDIIRANQGYALHADGGRGNDDLIGGMGNDVLAGGLGSDSLSGKAGADILYGGAGGDFVEGGTGSDILHGGSGADAYSIGLSQGYDIISDDGDSASDTLRLYGGTTITSLTAVTLAASGNDLLVTAVANGATVINIRIAGEASSSNRIEWLELYAGPNEARVGDAMDLTTWWAAQGGPTVPPPPTVTPGPQSHGFTTGDDSVIRGDGDDVLTTKGRGLDYVELGGGTNSLMVDLSWTGEPVYAGPNSGYYAFQTGNGSVNRTTVSGLNGIALFAGSGNDSLTGLSVPDGISGGGGNDYIDGNGGGGIGDALLGQAGDDTINARSRDWVDGGEGNDLVWLDLSSETRDIIYSRQLTTSVGGQTLVDGTHVAGVERFYLTTGSGNDVLTVDPGLVGKTAFSRYDQNNWSAGDGVDRLVADLSATTDQVMLEQGYYYHVLGLGERKYDNYGSVFPRALYFDGVEAFTVAGGSANDRLGALDGDDVLSGNGGDDYIDAGNGTNILDGGSGNDTLYAGGGSDTLRAVFGRPESLRIPTVRVF